MNRSMIAATTVGLMVVSWALVPGVSNAQYRAATTKKIVSTVEDARVQGDGQPVVLRGRLMAKVGEERYLFKDETGQIFVEIDDEDMRAIGANDVVALYGKVDTHRFKPTDIGVEELRVVER